MDISSLGITGVAAITVAIVIFVFAARWGRKIMEVRG